MARFSIITINYNNANGLQNTIKSVLSQTFTDLEYIIIDGGSKDGSVDVIKQYADSITCWISERDRGIYHAMNKGIKKANGDYLLFLNSGDYFFNSSVLESCSTLIDESTDICSGNLIMINGLKQEIVAPVKKVSLYYCVYAGLTHPNTFIRRTLFDRYGFYNEDNKIVSDWEFFLIALGLNNSIYQSIDVNVACFNMDGVSSDLRDPILLDETKSAIQKHIPQSILIDLKRLHYLEGKINQANFRSLLFIEKYPLVANFIFFQLRVFRFVLKRINNR